MDLDTLISNGTFCGAGVGASKGDSMAEPSPVPEIPASPLYTRLATILTTTTAPDMFYDPGVVARALLLIRHVPPEVGGCLRACEWVGRLSSLNRCAGFKHPACPVAYTPTHTHQHNFAPNALGGD